MTVQSNIQSFLKNEPNFKSEKWHIKRWSRLPLLLTLEIFTFLKITFLPNPMNSFSSNSNELRQTLTNSRSKCHVNKFSKLLLQCDQHAQAPLRASAGLLPPSLLALSPKQLHALSFQPSTTLSGGVASALGDAKASAPDA